MPPRKGGATKANAKTASAIGPDHVLNNTGPRGATSTRGGKRRRTSNNVSNDNHSGAAETVVVANPFDDDNDHQIHNQHHHQTQNHYQYQQPHKQQNIYHHNPASMNQPPHHHMGQHQHSIQHGNMHHQQAPNMGNRQTINNHDPNGIMQGHPQHQHHMPQNQIAPGHLLAQQHQQQLHMGGPHIPPPHQINHVPQNHMQHHQQQPAPNMRNISSPSLNHHLAPSQSMYNSQPHVSNQTQNSTSPKMIMAQTPQHFQHQQQQGFPPHQMHSGYTNPEYIHHPQASQPNNQVPPQQVQQQPPIIHQSHPNNIATPPTQMIPAGQSPIIAPENVNSPHMTSASINVNGPPQSAQPASHHQQMALHNQGGQIMTSAPIGPSQADSFGPPQPQLQQQVTSNLPQNQMIGTSTPPHVINNSSAPSQSPYMKQQGQPVVVQQPPPPQQVHMHAGPMAQSMTPQPIATPMVNQSPHLATTNDQMLIHSQQQQDQAYVNNQSLYCGKCQREFYHNEANIICKASCRASFHIGCSGLTDEGYHHLMAERFVEWICDRCSSEGVVPYVKYKS